MFGLSKHVYAFSSVWVNYERVIRNLFYEEERREEEEEGGGELIIEIIIIDTIE